MSRLNRSNSITQLVNSENKLRRRLVICLLLGYIATTLTYVAIIAQPVSNMEVQLPPAPVQTVTTAAVTTTSHPPKFRICLMGDNNLATYSQSFHVGIHPYKYVMSELTDCDLKIVNLENNLSHPGVGTIQPKGYNFRAPLESLKWMQDFGITAVSLANNHTMDFGPDALIQQMELIDSAGIIHFGAGKNLTEAYTPKYIVYQNVRIALIGVNDTENSITDVKTNRAGSAFLDITNTTKAIQTARQNADLVIVMPHWGVENSMQHTTRQTNYARRYIDAGADLIVGAGPHVEQAQDRYQNKHISYSLGNFAACGMFFVHGGSTGGVLKVDMIGTQVTSIEHAPVKISWFGLPSMDYTKAELYTNDFFKEGP